jgi:hypothetical protein
MNSPKIRLNRSPWYKGSEILITEGDSVASHLTMTPIKPNEACEPSLRITDAAAQTLMDDLWQAGYRPTEGSGSAGAMAAQGRHLEDMRRIVFGGEE